MRCKFSKIFKFCCASFFCSFFDCIESTKMFSFIFNIDVGRPSFSISRNASNSACVVSVFFDSIKSILRCIYATKIASAVIKNISIYMINSLFVFFIKTKNYSVKHTLWDFGSANSTLRVYPKIIFDQFNIFAIDYCEFSVNMNIYICNIPINLYMGCREPLAPVTANSQKFCFPVEFVFHG